MWELHITVMLSFSSSGLPLVDGWQCEVRAAEVAGSPRLLRAVTVSAECEASHWFCSDLTHPHPHRTIYEKLAGAVTEEQRTLYSQRVEEIAPNIRYCAYNMGDMPTDVSQLMKLRSDAPGSDMLASKIDVSLPTRRASLHVQWQGMNFSRR